jgi:hypothetical protein
LQASKASVADRSTRPEGWALGLLLAALLALTGCTSDFTRPNYETIYRGMDARQVRRRLGPPDVIRQDRWIYRGQRPFRQAVIHFEQGHVIRKQWFLDPLEDPE